MRTTTCLFSILILFISACQQPAQQEVSGEYQIPALLQRSEAIYNGKEWDLVQNKYGEARKALTGKPEALEPRLDLAELFVNEARISGEHGHYYPAALKLTDEILAAKPKDKDILFRALVLKAGIQLSQHDFANALQSGKKAMEINPYNAWVYGILTDANVELGNYEEAVKMADKMVATRPDLRSYSRVSYLREIHGDIKGAIEAMEMAVEAGYPGYEQSAWTRLTLGHLYEQYGDPQKAEMHYLIALEERPGYPFAQAALADLKIKQGQYVEAEQLLKTACEAIPEVGFYESLAEIYQATGRTAEFEKTMVEIWEMLEDDVKSGHNMNLEYAQLYAGMANDPQKALEYAKKEWEKRPDNIDVNRILAGVLLKTGDVQAANEHLKAAGRTNSQHPELLELRGLLAGL